MNSNPFKIEGVERPGRIVFLCDHASNHVPSDLPERLDLPAEDMVRHIAFDIGAAGITRAIAAQMDGPAALSNFSRLVIDPNRGEDDPTLVMRLYDGSIIPANRFVDRQEITRRIETLHRPYHTAVANLVAARAKPILVSIHSFTPQLKGRPKRPWEVGVLYADDARLAGPFLTRLREAGICVGDNEPYSGHLPGDTMDQHALNHGHAHVLIEVRNDLIETDANQEKWASKLAPILSAAIVDAGV
ncbi:MAG: N-formylglutamate amidohydrolase [Litoreibacter sp.]